MSYKSLKRGWLIHSEQAKEFCGRGEKIAKIFMFEFIMTAIGKCLLYTQNFPSHSTSCRNCLIKQANMAKARRNFACLSVLYAKNIKFNKTNMYGEIFYSFSWKHENFHSVSRHPTSRQLQQPLEWKIWNYHHSSKHYFLRIFDVHTFYDMHTLICGSRRGFEWAEEIIITSKWCRNEMFIMLRVWVCVSVLCWQNY